MNPWPPHATASFSSHQKRHRETTSPECRTKNPHAVYQVDDLHLRPARRSCTAPSSDRTEGSVGLHFACHNISYLAFSIWIQSGTLPSIECCRCWHYAVAEFSFRRFPRHFVTAALPNVGRYQKCMIRRGLLQKRVKGLEPSTFSLGSCAPEFEGTATSTVTDDAAATMRNACPTPRPKATQSGHDSQLVAALSMLAELPLPDEVKVAALRKILRV
jgi:hypothetical protein